MSDVVEPSRSQRPSSTTCATGSRGRGGRSAETADDWSQGVPLAYARGLCEYWRTHYDWRRAEAKLGGVPQFRTEIDGLGIH